MALVGLSDFHSGGSRSRVCDTDTVRECVCPCPSRMFCFFALTEVKDQTLTLTGGQNSVLLFWRTQERPWQWWTSRDDRKRERRKQNTSQHLSPMATGAKTFPVRADHQSASFVKKERGSPVQSLWLPRYLRLKPAEEAAVGVVTFDLWLYLTNANFSNHRYISCNFHSKSKTTQKLNFLNPTVHYECSIRQ